MLTTCMDHCAFSLAAALLGQDGGQSAGAESLKTDPVEVPQSDYRAEVFWAYASVCILLLLFMLWSAWQSRRLGEQLKYLEERFQHRFPEGEERPR